MMNVLINPANGKPKVIAAIPAFNEERFIGSVIKTAQKYVSQVMVIDDGSTDKTRQTAAAYGALILRHEINQGYGISIRDCLENARVNNADILVTIDGDGQHDPSEIPKVIAPILKGEADLVIGSRFFKLSQDNSMSTPSEMPRYRKFGISIITGLFNIGSKVRVSDAQSGFRAYSRTVFNNIALSETGMAVSIEILVKARKKKFRFKEVPIVCKYGLNRHSVNPVSHGLTVALLVIKLRFKTLFDKLGAQ